MDDKRHMPLVPASSNMREFTLRALLIGHSQGGIQAVKILHELAGTYGDHLHVVNPVTGVDEIAHGIGEVQLALRVVR